MKLLSVLIVLATLPCQVAAAVVDGVVAAVNSEVILLSELNEITRLSLAYEGNAEPDEALFREMRRKVLGRFIDDRILLEQAKAESVVISEEEVSAVFEQQLDNYQRQYGTMAQFETEWEKQTGIPFSRQKRKLRKEIRQNLLKQRYTDKMLRKTTVTREEVVTFFTENKDSLPQEQASIHLSHILMYALPPSELEEKARAKITDALLRVRDGESFEKLAVSLSEGPSAQDSGDIGFVKKGSLGMPEFENAAFALNGGDVSGIVRTNIGYHAIKCVERTDREVHVRHIVALVQPGEETERKIVAQLDSLAGAVGDSAGFAVAAATHSEDENTRHKGGILGWYTRDRLTDEYLKAVLELKTGQTGKPTKIGNAYHLFHVNRLLEKRDLTLEDDHKVLESLAIRSKVKDTMQEKLKKWRSRFHIQENLSEFESASIAR